MRHWPSVPQASSGQLTHGRCLRIRLAPVLGGLKTSEAGSALPISGYHASYALRPIRCAACGGGPTHPAVLTIVPHVSLGGLVSSRSQSPCRICFPPAVAFYPRSPNPTAELGYDSLLRNPSLTRAGWRSVVPSRSFSLPSGSKQVLTPLCIGGFLNPV